jgi:hypothetical protein
MPERRRGDPARPGFGRRQSKCRRVAFSRSGAPNLGDFEDAVILKTFGQMPDDLAASQSA